MIHSIGWAFGPTIFLHRDVLKIFLYAQDAAASIGRVNPLPAQPADNLLHPLIGQIIHYYPDDAAVVVSEQMQKMLTLSGGGIHPVNPAGSELADMNVSGLLCSQRLPN